MKKFLSLFLVVVLMSVNTFAASRNELSTGPTVVKDEDSLARLNFNITPYNEVETGTSIFIEFNNATVFEQDIIDGTSTNKEEYGYNDTGYQYSYCDWDRSQGFYDVMPKLDTAQLPYKIRRLNDHEIEVYLINLPDIYANNSLDKVNGVGRTPYYSIPIVAYADGVGYVTATIDGNGSSISSDKIENAEIYEKKTETTSEITTKEASTETTTVELLNESKNVSVKIGSEYIEINGTKVKIDAPSYIQIKSQSTLVPLRAVSEVFGDVDWVAETKTAIVKYNGNVVEFTANSDTMKINGRETQMKNGVTAEITSSRMFVPFRALGEALGLDVDWIADSKTAIYTEK